MINVSYLHRLDQNAPMLFKKNLKLVDTNAVIELFLLSKNIARRNAFDIIVRINNNTFAFHEALEPFTKNGRMKKSSYEEIASGLKETLRRVKISIALDKEHKPFVVEWWKYAAGVLKKDAVMLKDTRLAELASNFEKQALELKAN